MGSLPLLAAPAKGADKIAITGLAAGPAPFDPPAVPLTITTTFQVRAALVMGGGQGDQLTHHINATTSIKNAQGTTVRTLAGTTQVDVDAPATQGNDLVAAQVVVTWDGTDDQGRPVPDGNYGIQASGTLVKKTTGAGGEIRESAVSASETATTTATLSFGEIAASITRFPPNPSNAASATFAFTVNVAGCTFERSLDGGPFVPAASSETLTNLAEGSHTYQVRVVGPTGVPDPSAVSYTWTIDLTPPETTLTQTPPDPSNAASPSFVFSASEAGCAFERSLDGGEFVLATSPDTVGPLADGPHTVQVRARDAAGNTDPSPASFAWTVDTIPPDTAIAQAPPALSNAQAAAFAYAATEPGCLFERSLDGSPFVPAGAEESIPGLAEGPHTLAVRALDAAGNADPTPALYSWTIDTTPPETTLTCRPETLSGTATAVFAFAAGEAGCAYEYRLNDGDYTPVVPPLVLEGLPDGVHTIDIRAVDAAGNADPAPASFVWLIDTATLTAFTFDLEAGYNFIGLPVRPTEPLTAQALLDRINAQGGMATRVLNYIPETEGYETYTVEGGGPNFAIEPGKGYGVFCTANVPWVLSGYRLDQECGVVPLVPGYNLVALPVEPVPYNRYYAERVLDEIVAQNGGVELVTRMLRYNGTGYDVHPIGTGSGFSVVMGEGYFIRCTAPATWTVWRDVPAPPVITTPPGFTSDNTPEVAGTARPGATILLFEGTALLATGMVAPDGTWAVSPGEPLPDGVHALYAKAVDTVGASGPSSPVTLTIDTAPQTSPPLPPQPERYRLIKLYGDDQSGVVNTPFPVSLMWQVVYDETGDPAPGVTASCEIIEGEGVIVPAPEYPFESNPDGYAAAQVVPLMRPGNLTVQVSIETQADLEPLLFHVASVLPRIDLFRIDWGPEHTTLRENCGTGRTTADPGAPRMWKVFPGEPSSSVLGVQVFDAGGLPMIGVDVAPRALGDDGTIDDTLAEFFPSRARTDAWGRAAFATRVLESTPTRVLAVRFELPAFQAGDGTPLGCTWLQPVEAGDRLTWIESGQAQVATPGLPLPSHLVFRGGETSLRTTQPGDRLALVSGRFVSSNDNPDGSQTLTFSPDGGVAQVSLSLGPAPLPRVLGISREAYTTTVVVAPPEVRLTRPTTPQGQDFKPLEFVVPVTMFGADGALRDEAPRENEFYVEMLAPVQAMPAASVTLHLEGLTVCREPVSAGRVTAPPSRDVVATFAGVVDGRHTLYRSAPMLCSVDPADPGLVQTGIGRLPGGQDVIGGAPFGDVLCQAGPLPGVPPPAAALPLFNYMPRHSEMRRPEPPPFLLRRFIAVPIGDIPDQGDRVDPVAELADYSPSITILFNPRNLDFTRNEIRCVSSSHPDRTTGFETTVVDNEIIGSLRFPRMAQNARPEGEARLAFEVRDRQGRLYRGELDVVLVRQRLVQTIYGEAGPDDPLPPRLGIADVVRNRLDSPLGFPGPTPNTLDRMLVPSQFNALNPNTDVGRETALATSTANLHATGNRNNAGARYRGSAIAAATVLLNNAITANLTGGALGYFAPLYVEEDRDNNPDTVGAHAWQGAELLGALQTRTAAPPEEFITPGFVCYQRTRVRRPGPIRVTGAPNLPALNPLRILVVTGVSEDLPAQVVNNIAYPARIGGTVFVRQKPAGDASVPTVIRHNP